MKILFRRINEAQNKLCHIWHPRKIKISRLIEEKCQKNSDNFKEISKIIQKSTKCFLHGYNGLPEDYTYALAHAFLMGGGRSAKSKHIQELVDYTENISATLIPTVKWLSIYDACYVFGNFDLLLPLRRKAIESAYAEEKKHPSCLYTLQQSLRASMDDGDHFKTKKKFDQIESRFYMTQDINDIMSQYLLYTKQTDKASDLAQQRSKIKNANIIWKLIEGKSVAIVGPAPDGNLTGGDIDNHDVVVRMNYRGLDSLGDYVEFGKRTDISYYNGLDSRILHKNEFMRSRGRT